MPLDTAIEGNLQWEVVGDANWVRKRSTPRTTINQVDGIPDAPEPAMSWYPGRWAKARNYLWKVSRRGWIPVDLSALVLALNQMGKKP